MDLQPNDLTDAGRAELTSHAMLVPWGLFAQQIGLAKGLWDVPIGQRTRDHTPQDKLIEFFVATLIGLRRELRRRTLEMGNKLLGIPVVL